MVQSQPHDRGTTVIVGAGVSGLTVARELLAADRDVVVVEARDRVGGRLLSHPVPDHSHRLDLGATWFWQNEPLINTLLQEFDIGVFAQHIDGDAMYHQPDQPQRIEGNPIDAPSGRFSAGADSLTSALLAELPSEVVRLSHPVVAVDSSGAGLTVTTQHGDVFAGSDVVLALPPALAVHQIAFTPALPEQLSGLAAITPVWMGAITKVVVRYPTAFWRDAGLAGAAISHVGPLREIHDMSGPDGEPPALFGFAPAQPGTPTIGADDVIGQLVDIFGPQAAEASEIIIHDWRHEPYTSPPGVESLGAYQTYGHALYAEPAFDGRLHWSSTETAAQSPGHIEGAIVAAHRTVRTILTRSSS